MISLLIFFSLNDSSLFDKGTISKMATSSIVLTG